MLNSMPSLPLNLASGILHDDVVKVEDVMIPTEHLGDVGDMTRGQPPSITALRASMAVI